MAKELEKKAAAGKPARKKLNIKQYLKEMWGEVKKLTWLSVGDLVKHTAKVQQRHLDRQRELVHAVLLGGEQAFLHLGRHLVGEAFLRLQQLAHEVVDMHRRVGEARIIRPVRPEVRDELAALRQPHLLRIGEHVRVIQQAPLREVGVHPVEPK